MGSVAIAQTMSSLNMKYEPIETAPKDGTHILVFDGHDWVLGFWTVGLNGWFGDHPSIIFRNYISERKLTHWMPQPAKPQEEKP